MPTYEYECKSCSHKFEVFQSINAQPIKDCPKCGKEVRRLIFGGTGVIFKGSGFYVTDKNKNDKSGKSTAGTGTKPAPGTPAADAKSKNGENSQSTPVTPTAPAASTPCVECHKKGVSAACPA